VAKILVADDNSNIQKMVGLALKDQGIDVVAVGNGEAAVRKISDLKPDLVLADVFMPVRNGYEVCRYVKEDPSLAHIPVILLVGAFDPLDEQEAQRSGADGVLKKPFVPPDPLISMVKSALIRAGVQVGPPPAAEKAPAPPRRSTADILNAGVSSKLAALSPQAIPEVVPEPLEEFPTAPAHLKIAAGQEPLAFGSLLETPEEEADAAVTAKPMIELADSRKWDEESDDVAEEKEEEDEAPRGGWQPSGLDEEIEQSAAPSKAAPDWRDEAFHGSSPAQSELPKHWIPSPKAPEFVEAAGAQTVAVATKPAEEPAPFSGDAWAAAVAADVEKKIVEVKDFASVTHKDEPVTEVLPGSAAPALEGSAVGNVPAPEEAKSAEPSSWSAVPETAWDLEAKKASLLASTWDAPKTLSVDETQEIPVYAAHAPETHVEAPVDEAPSAYSSEPLLSGGEEAHAEAPVEETPEAEAPSEPAVEAPEVKDWKIGWEAPVAAPAPSVAEETPVQAAPVEAAHVEEPAATPAPVEEAAAAPVQPDMDELVARVLQRMNPEVLQKVTQEILKPVIEAIIRDEIDSKKK